ncbi:hypothetical protein ACLOJK_034751 [Asimina triloba]
MRIHGQWDSSSSYRVIPGQHLTVNKCSGLDRPWQSIRTAALHQQTLLDVPIFSSQPGPRQKITSASEKNFRYATGGHANISVVERFARKYKTALESFYYK